jgi:hypothetical protein
MALWPQPNSTMLNDPIGALHVWLTRAEGPGLEDERVWTSSRGDLDPRWFPTQASTKNLFHRLILDPREIAASKPGRTLLH